MQKDKITELKIQWCDLDRQIRNYQAQLEKLQKELALVARELYTLEQSRQGEVVQEEKSESTQA